MVLLSGCFVLLLLTHLKVCRTYTSRIIEYQMMVRDTSGKDSCWFHSLVTVFTCFFPLTLVIDYLYMHCDEKLMQRLCLYLQGGQPHGLSIYLLPFKWTKDTFTVYTVCVNTTETFCRVVESKV